MTKTGSKNWLSVTGKEIKKNRFFPAFEFLARFCFLAVPFNFFPEEKLNFLRVMVAKDTARLLGLLGRAATSNEFWVKTAFAQINVIPACTGWRSAAAFLALVLALPKKSWLKRARALVALPVIYGANVFRLATVALAAEYGMSAVVHDFLWREGLILMVLFFWLTWWKAAPE